MDNHSSNGNEVIFKFFSESRVQKAKAFLYASLHILITRVMSYELSLITQNKTTLCHVKSEYGRNEIMHKCKYVCNSVNTKSKILKKTKPQQG
jgi:hypothetical protein